MLALALSLVAPLPAAAAEESDGAALYVACAVCHQPDGAGIEGSFPPLRGRLAAVASTPAGRGYLVLVLAKGLFGSIEVADVPYYGAMRCRTLARISHGLSTAEPPSSALTALRSVGLLDVQYSTPARASVATPCQDGARGSSRR